MWLIDVKTWQLKFFHDCTAVEYAILSHRWREEEVTFAEIQNFWSRRFSRKKGWARIQKCGEPAAEHGLAYAWVDTCCIDKSSSAELQEAINSMFKWYQRSSNCFVYLDDVTVPANLAADYTDMHFHELVCQSEWFERGWTLQELIASPSPYFYDRNWCSLGRRHENSQQLELITGIPSRILGLESTSGLQTSLRRLCIAEKMTWVRNRKTAREEDVAYALLGLFDVNMPMLYGEGQKAFTRLLEEIPRSSADQSIIACEGFPYAAESKFRNTLSEVSDFILPRSADDFAHLDSAWTWDSLNMRSRRGVRRVEFGNLSLDTMMIPLRTKDFSGYTSNIDLCKG